MGITETGGVLKDGGKHRLKFTGRTTDDPQNFGRGRLLLQPPRLSSSSRAFSIATTACAAKFFTSLICSSVNGRTSWRLRVKAPTKGVAGGEPSMCGWALTNF